VRRLLAVLLVCLAALPLLAGCGAVQSNAATVNGTDIRRKDVDDELEQIRDNPGYRQALNIRTIEGSGGRETFDAAFAAQVLTLRIYYELVDQELAKRHVTLTAAELQAARQDVVAQTGTDPQTGAPNAAAGERVLRRFSSSYRDEVIHRQAAVARLTTVLGEVDVSDAAVRKYYDENQSQFAQVCAQHILVDTKAEADDVRNQLVAGADFGTVAAARSKDPSAKDNKGDLGCQSPDSYVPEFGAAITTQPIGEIGQPVQTQFGFHVIRVTQRTTQPFEQVRDQIRQQLAGQGNQALNEWLVAALRKAEITVSPAFGTFDRTPADGGPGKIVPPAAPTTVARRSTTTTSAP
jgi:parvulin-like peptidyl-prolyl isomerase